MAVEETFCRWYRDFLIFKKRKTAPSFVAPKIWHKGYKSNDEMPKPHSLACGNTFWMTLRSKNLSDAHFKGKIFSLPSIILTGLLLEPFFSTRFSREEEPQIVTFPTSEDEIQPEDLYTDDEEIVTAQEQIVAEAV